MTAGSKQQPVELPPRYANIKQARRAIDTAILEAGQHVESRAGRSLGVEARWQAWLADRGPAVAEGDA